MSPLIAIWLNIEIFNDLYLVSNFLNSKIKLKTQQLKDLEDRVLYII